MSKSKSTEYKDDGVQFDKATGDAYVDMRDVIESELRRIRAKRAKGFPDQTSGSVLRNNDKDQKIDDVKSSK